MKRLQISITILWILVALQAISSLRQRFLNDARFKRIEAALPGPASGTGTVTGPPVSELPQYYIDANGDSIDIITHQLPNLKKVKVDGKQVWPPKKIDLTWSLSSVYWDLQLKECRAMPMDGTAWITIDPFFCGK